MIGAQLVIKTRTERETFIGDRHAETKRQRLERRREHRRVDDRIVIDQTSLKVHKERRLLRDQRPTDTAAIVTNLEWLAPERERIAGVQTFIAEIIKGAELQFVHTRLSQNIDPSESDVAVLSIERILIDAYLPN